jgi:hypothetical protein
MIRKLGSMAVGIAAVIVTILILAAVSKNRNSSKSPDPESLRTMTEDPGFYVAPVVREAKAQVPQKVPESPVPEAKKEPLAPEEKPEEPPADAKREPQWIDVREHYARDRSKPGNDLAKILEHGMIRQGDVALTVDRSPVDFAKVVRKSRWPQLGWEGGDIYVSDERTLHLSVRVKNYGKKPATVSSNGKIANDPEIKLVDNFGKRLRMYALREDERVAGSWLYGPRLEPGQLILDTLLFEVPRRDIDYLRLTLKDYVKGEEFYLQIPGEWIDSGK